MRKNIRQKFSIRKFTIGTGSILLGLTFMIGLGTSAQAAEEVETSKIQEVVTTISSEDTSTSEVNDENATNTEDSTLELEKQISSEELADELIEKPEITSDSTEEVETDRTLEDLAENPIVEEEVIEEVVGDESTETEVEESYIQTKYPEQEYNVTPTVPEDKRDKDQRGKLEYLKETNGYISTQERTVEESVQTCENCTADKVTTKYTNKVDLNAESVMDTNLDDYSNNGYIVKVKNPNNHPGMTEGFEPGNLEVQHWQDSNVSAGTTTQYWRIVFASDYAINNTVMRVSLPYSSENIQTTDVSSWVANRYYPAVMNNNNKYTEIISPTSILFEGNDAILNFGSISANSVFGMMFTKSFATPENPDDVILSTSVNVSGEWNEEELIRQLDYINSSLTPEQVEYINEVCVIPEEPVEPTDPVDPEEPTDPVDPEEPTDPEDPEEPTDPVDPEDPEEPTDLVDPEEPLEQEVAEQPAASEKSEQPVKSSKSTVVVTSKTVDNSTPKNVAETSEETLPNTGENENKSLTLIGSVLTMLGAVLVFTRRKKTN